MERKWMDGNTEHMADIFKEDVCSTFFLNCQLLTQGNVSNERVEGEMSQN
jgi:hypothetical protein